MFYQGTYTVPAGQTITRFEYVAERTAGGNPTQGNFIDAIRFGPLCDHGDADSDYPVLRANGGAAHVNNGTTFLGNSVRIESDGQPSVTADGDDGIANDADNFDDEDGVTFTSILRPGTTATAEVSASVPGYLSGWIDFNNDNDWDDPGEQVFTNEFLSAGTNNLDFAIPTNVNGGDSFARFRFSTGDSSTPTGIIGDGEVEDYQVTLANPPVACNGRNIAELSFQNPVLESGNNLQVGATYRFANVILGIDALVTIDQFNNGAVLAEIDNSVDGTNDAFQPILNPAQNIDSSVDFTITWVDSGTITPRTIDAFNASGIDIDGNGESIREYIELEKFSSYILEDPTELNATYNDPTGRFESRTTDTKADIDIDATENIVTAEYNDESSFRYRIGALDSGTGTTNRQNSISFRCLEFNNPQQNLTTSDPDLLLVKRITAISPNRSFNSFVNDSREEDNNPLWLGSQPGAGGNANTYTVGEIDGGQVVPGDEVEYSIYFLSSGNDTAKNVLVCDLVPENMEFVPNGFENEPPATNGSTGAARGLLWEYDGTVESLTNGTDGDAGYYFPPGIDPASVFSNIKCGSPNKPNNNGAVVIDLGDIPEATAPGTPINSYGFIRFRAKVK